MAPLNQNTDLHVSAVTKFDRLQWLTVHHRPLDIEVMLGLHTKVNIIPVIAKVILMRHIWQKLFAYHFAGRHIYSSGKEAIQRKGKWLKKDV